MELISNDDIMQMFKDIDKVSGKEIYEHQDQIIKKLIFLVYHQAKPYKKFNNYEDLVQEGCVGLIKAVRNFDHTRFPNFFIFCNQWIRHHIKRAASKFDIVYNPEKHRTVYSEMHTEEEIDEDYDLEEIVYASERQKIINKVLDEFSNRDNEIVREIFGIGGIKQRTLREIGKEMGLTHERIRQINNRMLDKLRNNKQLQQLNGEMVG